jgi:hypothetical protein
VEQLVVLCLVLTIGTIAFAQQPAEWRPNIAEDNKAATWEDTGNFIANTLEHFSTASVRATMPSRCHMDVSGSGPDDPIGVTVRAGDAHSLVVDAVSANSFGYQIGLRQGMKILAGEAKGKTWQFRTTDDFKAFEATLKTGDRVVLGVQSADRNSIIRMGPGGFGNAIGVLAITESSYVVDFSKVDPLSLVVREQTVSFSGSMNGAFLMRKSGESGDPTPDFRPLFWPISDLEMSKRLARAVMHTALVCGGTKGVSPF